MGLRSVLAPPLGGSKVATAVARDVHSSQGDDPCGAGGFGWKVLGREDGLVQGGQQSSGGHCEWLVQP